MSPEELLADLTSRLSCAVLSQPQDTTAYTRDASSYLPQGQPLAVVLPESTEDVSAALAWANEHEIPVSIRGGGTGLAGGAVSYDGGLVLALDRLNKILAIDPVNKLADIQPGVITAELDAAAHEHGLFFAPDPASSATSTVGGNIATNAGGLRCVAHGVTLDAVAALEVVLADGSIIHTGSRTIKNVSGYNLTQLFVGSEGTLGVITAATVRLKTAPVGDPFTFAAHFDSLQEASQAVLDITSQAEPESLELMDAATVALVERHFPSGLEVPGAALVLGLCVGADAEEKAGKITQICVSAGAGKTEVASGHALMEARRLANAALKAENITVFGDVGVPMSKLPDIAAAISRISVESGKRVSIVAHAGDGNLHPSIEGGTTPEAYAEGEAVLMQIVAEAIKLGGTITGEHGVGALKRHELAMQYSPQTLAVQHAIKTALDPKNILTPGRAI